MRFLVVVALDWRLAMMDGGRGMAAALFAASGESSSSGSAGGPKMMGCFIKFSGCGSSRETVSSSLAVTFEDFRSATRLFAGFSVGVGVLSVDVSRALIVDCVLATRVGFGKGGRIEIDAARGVDWGLESDSES